jgi:hypothetical protein
MIIDFYLRKRDVEKLTKFLIMMKNDFKISLDSKTVGIIKNILKNDTLV